MKATNGTAKDGKERRVGLWAVSFIAIFQIASLVLLSTAIPAAVKFTSFVVNSTLDEADATPGDGVCLSASGYCTLRAAIQEANALPGPQVIKLNAGLYMLTIAGRSENNCATGDLDITDDLTITGKAAKNTFVNGGKLDRVFHLRGSISVTITNLTIQNGLAADDGYGNVSNANGGGILNESDCILTLNGITISKNTAAGSVNNNGGGIYNSGTLAITKSTLSNNTAFGGSDSNAGGAILNAGTLTIQGTTISNNIVSGSAGYGGGLLNTGIGVSTITRSTISNNTASGGWVAQGGGIANNSTLTITGSTISNNTAIAGEGDGGGIHNVIFSPDQKLTITGSIITNNVARGDPALGGGLCGFGAKGEVIIEGSTLSYNVASGGLNHAGLGGGVYLRDGTLTTLTVQSASKIVQNFSSDSGGGIYYSGSGTGSISAESMVTQNIPDDIYP